MASRSPSPLEPDGGFDGRPVDPAILRARAYNMRWAEQPDDVIPLTAADSDLAIPPVVARAIAEYTAAGSLPYGPVEGLPGYREAVALDLGRRGIPARADGVLATDGAASALFLVARAVLAPGDEIVNFDPVDYLIGASAEAAGATVRRVPFTREHGLDLDALKAAITPRTRMISLCNPHNPLGRILRPEAMRAVAALAEAHDLLILSDEVWADISYDGPCPSVAGLGPEASRRTIVVGGFSKSYGLAGLRIGFVRTDDPALFERIVAASHARVTVYGAATLSQIAAEAALRHGQPWQRAFLKHLRGLRDTVCDRLDALDGLRCPRPEATFVAFARIERPGLDADTLTARILAHARVAVVSGGRYFGPRGAGHIRLTFATARPIVEEALARIEAAWPRIIDP